MVLKLDACKNQAENLLKYSQSPLESFDLVDLAWETRICPSNKFLGDATANQTLRARMDPCSAVHSAPLWNVHLLMLLSYLRPSNNAPFLSAAGVQDPHQSWGSYCHGVLHSFPASSHPTLSCPPGSSHSVLLILSALVRHSFVTPGWCTSSFLFCPLCWANISTLIQVSASMFFP